jgi:peroxiredoxin
MLLSGAALTGCLVTSTSSGLDKGKPAPEIRGRDADGEPFQLSDYRGKVVLLDFWAAY